MFSMTSPRRPPDCQSHLRLCTLAHALSDPTPADQRKEQAPYSLQLKTLSRLGARKPQPEEQVEEHAKLAGELLW